MTTGLYVFGEYIKRLQTKFQQNKVNVSLRETARNPFPGTSPSSYFSAVSFCESMF